MSNYRKERNNIIISLDGMSGDYRLDINTGVLYGIKGTPIKVCPRKSEVVNLFPYYTYDRNTTNLAYLLHRMIANCTKTSQYANYVPSLVGAEKIDAVGIGCLHLYDEEYEYVGNHIKELVAYRKDNPTNFRFGTFKAWVEFEAAKSTLGSLADQLTAEMYSTIKRGLPSITTEEMSVCAYYLTRGKYWEYHDGSVGTLIRYIELCRLMELKPVKVNNFMREYCETRKSYQLRKTEFDNKRMANNYAKHSKAWEFEYGNYVVVIPKEGQEIVAEGQNMHHCVGGYVNRVVEGECYICFVRHKDTPDNCYITCQVYTNGQIGQYFLAHDRHITTEEDKDFKAAFQMHLARVWDN